MRQLWFGIVGAVALAVPAGADEPTAGPNSFHQLRPLSGLSGALHGFDSDGYESFTGPVALSTPVAHTIGHGRVVAAWSQYSFSTRPIFAAADGNWTAYAMYGATLGRFNVSASWMYVGFPFYNQFASQVQYIPSPGAHLALSVGLQDMFNQWPTPTDSGGTQSSRTFFGVGTYRISTGRAPVYVSAGIGTKRFRTIFGSVSHEIVRSVRLWVEHDTFDVNAGLLFSWPIKVNGRKMIWTTNIGRAEGRYSQFGTGLSF